MRWIIRPITPLAKTDPTRKPITTQQERAAQRLQPTLKNTSLLTLRLHHCHLFLFFSALRELADIGRHRGSFVQAYQPATPGHSRTDTVPVSDHRQITKRKQSYKSDIDTMRGYSYGTGGYGSSTAASGYGYTIATGLKGAPATARRLQRSNTFSWFPNGYTTISRKKVVDKTTSAQPAKHARHRAESGPASSIFSSFPYGIHSPKGRGSLETSREVHAPTSRRTSTASRAEIPRHRKSSEHRHHTHRKSHADGRGIPRHSFASLASRSTAPSAISRRMSTETKASRRRKSKGSYGLFSCFGR